MTTPRRKPAQASKPLSMADLARELGVSMTTVSRALSDHYSIGAATKQRVQKLARKLNYQPNHLAAALRKGHSRLLGVVVPYIEGEFFPAVIQGIERAASKAGYSVIICQSHEDEHVERHSVEMLLHAQVAGILVSLASTTQQYHHFENAGKRGVPVVFFDRIPARADVNAVALDDYEGGYLCTKHLLAQGYTRIAHLAGPQHLSIYSNRCRGYQDALREAGIASGELQASADLIRYTDMKQAQGAAAMHELLALPQPPDAVFAAGDYCALGAMQMAMTQGLRIPQDLAICGFSNEKFTLVTQPSLTSVDQRCEEMGQASTNLLLEALDAGTSFIPRKVLMRPVLVLRDSSKRVMTSMSV